MKYIEYLIWILGVLAGMIILLGLLDFFIDFELTKVNHDVNYFHVANSFLLMCISCTVYLIWNKQKEA